MAATVPAIHPAAVESRRIAIPGATEVWDTIMTENSIPEMNKLDDPKILG
jgi:hypothetical protein